MKAMTTEELKKKQRITEKKFKDRVPSNLHRVKGRWVVTEEFTPWFQENGVAGDKCTKK